MSDFLSKTFLLKYAPDQNDDFNIIKDKLANVGIDLEIHSEDDLSFLTITIKNDKFEKTTKRKAGRKEHASDYTYVDILIMRIKCNTLSDVAAAIKMPVATFYRRWDKLKKSWLWEDLDQSRINDIDYLESMQQHDGNYYF